MTAGNCQAASDKDSTWSPPDRLEAESIATPAIMPYKWVKVQGQSVDCSGLIVDTSGKAGTGTERQ